MEQIILKNVTKTFKIPHEKGYGIKSAAINTLLRRKKYETLSVLKDINLTVKKGDFLGITGRNGAGKSTLLRIIAGIIKPTKGLVAVRGKISPFLELGMGFQLELTAKENIYLYGTILGLKRRQIEEKFNNVIKFAELEKFIDTKLKNFSSGMVSRLAFSIAIQVDADILLVDEVLAVGDEAFKKKCFEVFKKFKKEKKTVILVSHDKKIMKEFCDKIIYLDRKK